MVELGGVPVTASAISAVTRPYVDGGGAGRAVHEVPVAGDDVQVLAVDRHPRSRWRPTSSAAVDPIRQVARWSGWP